MKYHEKKERKRKELWRILSCSIAYSPSSSAQWPPLHPPSPHHISIASIAFYKSLCLQKTHSYTHNSMKNSARLTKSVLFYPQLVIWLNDYKNLVTFVTVWLKFSRDADFDSIRKFSGVGHTLPVILSISKLILVFQSQQNRYKC